MAGVKGMKPLTPGKKAWDVKVQLPKEEWKNIRSVADDAEISMAQVMRIAWHRFYRDWKEMNATEKAKAVMIWS